MRTRFRYSDSLFVSEEDDVYRFKLVLTVDFTRFLELGERPRDAAIARKRVFLTHLCTIEMFPECK
jgi:hypothetical protein